MNRHVKLIGLLSAILIVWSLQPTSASWTCVEVNPIQHVTNCTYTPENHIVRSGWFIPIERIGEFDPEITLTALFWGYVRN